jgi:hypothetical protein
LQATAVSWTVTTSHNLYLDLHAGSDPDGFLDGVVSVSTPHAGVHSRRKLAPMTRVFANSSGVQRMVVPALRAYAGGRLMTGGQAANPGNKAGLEAYPGQVPRGIDVRIVEPPTSPEHIANGVEQPRPSDEARHG